MLEEFDFNSIGGTFIERQRGSKKAEMKIVSQSDKEILKQISKEVGKEMLQNRSRCQTAPQAQNAGPEQIVVGCLTFCICLLT